MSLLKKKEITKGKIYSPVSNLADRAKLTQAESYCPVGKFAERVKLINNQINLGMTIFICGEFFVCSSTSETE